MSYSGQRFVAATEGSQYTLYAMMKLLGIPLTPRQEAIQSQLEKEFPSDLSRQYTDRGTDEEGHGIGNCKKCGARGVIMSEHKCKEV